MPATLRLVHTCSVSVSLPEPKVGRSVLPIVPHPPAPGGGPREHYWLGLGFRVTVGAQDISVG